MCFDGKDISLFYGPTLEPLVAPTKENIPQVNDTVVYIYESQRMFLK